MHSASKTALYKLYSSEPTVRMTTSGNVPLGDSGGDLPSNMESGRQLERHGSMKEALEIAPFAKTTFYKFLNSGQIRAVKLGSRTLPWLADIAAVAANLPAYPSKHKSLSKKNKEHLDD